MADIVELERRITDALDRIGRGMEALETRPVMDPPPQVDPGEIEVLKLALADERIANAQLEERVKAIRDKQESQVLALQAQVEQSKEDLSAIQSAAAKLDAELQELRAANDALRANNAALRAANQNGVGDPDLINAGMAAELDSLRVSRDVERSEVQTVLAALTPLIGNATAEESI